VLELAEVLILESEDKVDDSSDLDQDAAEVTVVV
jgi:hypothetical protein